MSTETASVRKTALRDELGWAHAQLVGLLRSLSDEDLGRPSPNPAWTNHEALCHLALGFILLPAFVRLVRFWSLFPDGASRPFVGALDATTPAFNWVNARGPRLASRLYPGQKLGRRLDRAHARAQRMLDGIEERDLDREMRFPARWDPVYGDRFTLEKVFGLPAAHLRSHQPVVRLG